MWHPYAVNVVICEPVLFNNFVFRDEFDESDMRGSWGNHTGIDVFHLGIPTSLRQNDTYLPFAEALAETIIVFMDLFYSVELSETLRMSG